MQELATAYEGLEQSFQDAEALTRYRQAMSARSSPQADFLLERVDGAAGRVLEVGCGNGRLLIELARRGALESALGVDIAASRISFAREWARAEGHDAIEFEAADVLERPLESGSFQTALCITGAFAYFEPAVPGSAERLARALHEALAPGGRLFLELYPHPRERRLVEAAGGEVRLWQELPSEDPWRFYLSHLALDAAGDVLTHEKTFVHRHTREIDSGRRERLVLYSAEAISELLASAGFEDVQVCDGWCGEPYAGGDVMVVAARR
jgi:SAM-dependent methyltransferase